MCHLSHVAFFIAFRGFIPETAYLSRNRAMSLLYANVSTATFRRDERKRVETAQRASQMNEPLAFIKSDVHNCINNYTAT